MLTGQLGNNWKTTKGVSKTQESLGIHTNKSRRYQSGSHSDLRLSNLHPVIEKWMDWSRNWDAPKLMFLSVMLPKSKNSIQFPLSLVPAPPKG